MCGIAGIFSCGAFGSEDSMTIVKKMTDQIANRGPDASGYWNDYPIVLGHRRLSILELSNAGSQPMRSTNERYSIIFNGEIYNHLELRRELESHGFSNNWKGFSDTETLLACIGQWGVKKTLQSLKGMFAFVLWDKTEKRLYLTRDNIGEKPLYWGWAGGDLVFGSELKALRGHPNFPKEVCKIALGQYLRFMYVPAPWCIHPGIFKVEPGTLLTISEQPPKNPPNQPIRPGESYGSIDIERYWSLVEDLENQLLPVKNELDFINELEDVLTKSVKRQMLSDVPLGAFLSGGIDSSTIAALMQAQSSKAIDTFTVGFEDNAFDESMHAEKVAKHLGTNHNKLTVTDHDALNVIPLIPKLYDEPFADSSQIPTYLVCKAARQYVTVALSGDGGDELFGGYNRYFWGPKIWQYFEHIPFKIRHLLAIITKNTPLSVFEVLTNSYNRFMPGEKQIAHLADKVQRLGIRLSTVRSSDDLYRSLVSEWTSDMGVMKDQSTFYEFGQLDDILPDYLVSDTPAWMMAQDMRSYLPDDILCKVDRAAMGVSLETRVPFLDPDVIKLAMEIPTNMKIQGRTGKWILRQVLYKYVPQEIIDRPKAGFSIPLGNWLRTVLREWAEELLAVNRLNDHGLLNVEVVHKTWAEHISRKRDHTNKLWAILMFQAWYAAQS